MPTHRNVLHETMNYTNGVHICYEDRLVLVSSPAFATRVVSQVMKKFQSEIPLEDLFQSPTIAEMAALITENQAKRLGEKDLNRILSELESLSESEAQRRLADQR